jgi:hypothetical protein
MSKLTGKMTYKELADRITMAFTKIMEMHQNITYVHTLTLKYIKYKDDEKGFLKFVEEDRKKEEAKVREDENKLK